jgi:hypothetical protein
MQNKQTQAVCTFIAILSMLMLLTGCGKPSFHNRPSDKACMEWLTGQKVLLEKGWLSDGYWLIEAHEFEEFALTSVSVNDDGTSNAKLKFVLKAGARGLQVEGTLKYRFHKRDDAVEMLGFTVERLLKLGKW